MAKQAAKKASKNQAVQKKSSGGGLRPEQWIPWALAGLAFLVFSTGFSNPMVAMDDHSATVDNVVVKNFSLSAFGHFNLGMYAPLTWMGYALAYALGGKEAFWYHFFSAAAHAFNVVLAFRLLYRLEKNTSLAALAALFFAVHPLQVEAVSWIAGFSTPLFSLFSLLALNAYIAHTQEQVLGKKYAWALAFFVSACLSKSAAVALPLSLLVIDIWLKRPLNRQNWLEKAPFWGLALVFGLMTFYSRGEAGHSVSTLSGAYSIPDRFLMACHTVLFYWIKILAPIGLSIWYPFEKTASGGWHWSYYASPLILAALLWLAWRYRAKLPFVYTGVLFYLANIVLALPFYTIGTFELRSDRYNYLAALGIFAILAALPGFLQRKRPSWTGTSWALLALLSLFWLFTTIGRIRDWRDTLTLIDKAIAAQGDNFGKAYLWRGMTYGDQGEARKSLDDFNKAIQRDSTLTEAYKYRGALLGMQRQYEQSVADLSRYLKANPEAAEIYYNRGLSYINLNRHQDAVADFNKTIELNPDFYRAYRARGNAYQVLGDSLKAQSDLAEWEKRQAVEARKEKRK